MYLLDTNVVSELARPRPDQKVRSWLGRQSEVSISVITIEEILFGILKAPSARRPKLVAWFEDLQQNVRITHDVTPSIARAAADLRATRTGLARPVAQADMLIAATAVVHGLTLATRNVIDFDGCGVAVVDPFR